MTPLLWPRWAQGLALAAALVVAFLIWDHFDDKAAVEADRAKAAAEVTETARRADAASSAEIQASRADTEKGNADARKAAADDPDDPLAAGLRSLRSGSPASRPSPR